MTSSSKLLPLKAAQLAEVQRKGALVLDVRAPEQFVSFHIPGAIQIGLVGPFASWAAMLIAPAQNLVLVAENVRDIQEAHTRLIRIGLEHVIGYSLADEISWHSEGINLTSIAAHRCADICQTLQYDSSMQLVDVRYQSEWKGGHLPGAVSLPLFNLASGAAQLDRSRPTLVYSGEGYRTTTAASILLRLYFDDVAILVDGVEGWSAMGLPLETSDADSSDRLAIFPVRKMSAPANPAERAGNRI